MSLKEFLRIREARGMMGEILVSVLIMSAAGSALELLITLSAPLSSKIFNASWP